MWDAELLLVAAQRLQKRLTIAATPSEDVHIPHLIDRPGLLVVLPAADLHPVHEAELPGEEPAQVDAVGAEVQVRQVARLARCVPARDAGRDLRSFTSGEVLAGFGCLSLTGLQSWCEDPHDQSVVIGETAYAMGTRWYQRLPGSTRQWHAIRYIAAGSRHGARGRPDDGEQMA